jgi:hypothetical protein
MAVFEGRPLKPKIHSDQQLPHQERTEMKRRRETAQFFQYQQRLLNIGAPKMDSRRWGYIYVYIYIYYVYIYVYIYIYIMSILFHYVFF